MMKVLSRLVILASLAVLGADAVRACPLCRSETGERVRAGILNDDFAYHLLVTFLPFPVFLGVVAVMYFGPPWARQASRRSDSPEPGAAEEP